MRKLVAAGLALLLISGCSGESPDPGEPASGPKNGLGSLAGKVDGTAPGLLPVVYAYNTDKDLAYTVFVVDGEYRAVKMIPGRYDVTIRPAVDQLEGFDPQTVSIDLGPGDEAELDFSLTGIGPVVDYAGGRAPKTREAWAVTVDRMYQGPAFGRPGKASLFDPKHLPPEDRDILVDYLAEHFPMDRPPVVVQLTREPELDLQALKKAMS